MKMKWWNNGCVGENRLRCIAQDKKDLIVIVIFFPYILIPISVKNFVSAIF
jgi:hypothetical protein